MFVLDQCNEAHDGQGSRSDDHSDDNAPDHDRTASDDPADNAAAAHHSPAPEHDPVGGCGDDLLADDRFRQLLPGRRVLLKRRPRP